MKLKRYMHNGLNT